MKVVVEGYVFPKCRTICIIIWKSDEATHLGNCIWSQWTFPFCLPLYSKNILSWRSTIFFFFLWKLLIKFLEFSNPSGLKYKFFQQKQRIGRLKVIPLVFCFWKCCLSNISRLYIIDMDQMAAFIRGKKVKPDVMWILICFH